MKIFIIATLISTLYVVWDILFDEQLWDLNTTITTTLQEHNFNGETFIFELISSSIYLPIVVGSVYFLATDYKINSLLFLMISIIIITSNGLLKNAYHQTRPYMVEDSIEGLSCNKEYGKPSGHAQTSMTIFIFQYIYFPETFLFKVSTLHKPQITQQYNIASRFLITVALVMFTFLIGLSRVYLGVHSIGQVVLGWIYSLYIIIIYATYFHNRLREYLKEQFANHTSYNRFQYASYFAIISYAAVMAINITLLELNKYVFYTDAELLPWIAKVEICVGKQLNINDPLLLYNACFTQALGYTVVFAFIIACQYSPGYYEEGYFATNFQGLNGKQKLIRFAIFVIPSLILLTPIVLIPRNDVLIIGFAVLIPIVTLLVMYWTILFPHLLNRWHLQIQGDFLQTSKNGYTSIIDS